MPSNLAAAAASFSLVMAPVLMDFAGAVRDDDQRSEVADLQCVQRARSEVDQHFGGRRDTVARLARGTEVEVLNPRETWFRIKYSANRIGWIQASDLGPCSEVESLAEAPPSTTARASEAPRARASKLHPFGAPTKTPGGTLLQNLGYDCYYDPALKYCRWVAYCFRAGGEKPPRHSGFFPDSRLPSADRAELADYAGAYTKDLNGFDKGHMAPDATVKALGREAQKETYSLANITPQFSKMNQGIWREVEDAIRSQASDQADTCVETGPVFTEGKPIRRLHGPNRLAVPHAYYAIVVQGDAPAVSAFVVPNENQRRSYSDIMRYASSVDEIERLTSLDFLAELDDVVEADIEARLTEAPL
jgi:endonuclease G, mitochondrial